MNILLIGKFFPIQGGEATKAYCLMKALSSFGHNVSILIDTSTYSENKLCTTYNDVKEHLKYFKIYDKKNYQIEIQEMQKVIISVLLFVTINSFAGSPVFKCANCGGEVNRTEPLKFNGNFLSDTYGNVGYIYNDNNLYQMKGRYVYLVK